MEWYTVSWTERVYAELARRATEHLQQGERVIIDANFRQEAQRRLFLELAVRWGVPALMLHCQASDDVVRERLRHRQGDASDADWDVYQELAPTWEPFSNATQRQVVTLNADAPPGDVVEQAMRALHSQSA